MVSDTLDGTQLSILLHTLGLTDFLINPQCNRSDTPYAEAVDGWTYGKVLYIYKWNKQHKICIDQFMQNKCFVSFIGADSWQLYFFLFIIYYIYWETNVFCCHHFTLDSSTNKTDCHDITEILLNTITLTWPPFYPGFLHQLNWQHNITEILLNTVTLILPLYYSI